VFGGWLAIRLPIGVSVWLANGELPSGIAVRGVAREGTAMLEVALPSSRVYPMNEEV
jgi:hypothetical protein